MSESAMTVDTALQLATWCQTHERTAPIARVHDAMFVLAAEVLAARTRLARAEAAERVVEAVRLVGELENESSSYAIAARMRSIAHALAAYDATRGVSE